MEKVALLAALVALLPLTARADDKLEEAKAHVKNGAELYDENNFRAALVEFQRAYELAPSFKLLFNIGQIQMELQDYAGALKAYTRYLKEGGPDVPADRVALVNSEIERLKGRVGRLTIQTTAGAAILIDDVQVGFAPLPEPVIVNAGQHRVTVQSQGKAPQTRAYDVAGRQELTVALELEGPRAVVDPVAKPPSPPAGPPSRTPIYVSWGVTGALGIGAGIFAILANKESDKVGTLRDTFPVTPQQLSKQVDLAKRDAIIADSFLAATLVSAGIATYFTITRRERPRTETAIRLQPGLQSIGIAGTF